MINIRKKQNKRKKLKMMKSQKEKKKKNRNTVFKCSEVFQEEKIHVTRLFYLD